jgi:hypothetical protein
MECKYGINLEISHSVGGRGRPVPSPTRADLKAPTDVELELEEAWALQKERAYTEIDLRIEDKQRVVSCDNHIPHLAWNTLHMVYSNQLVNTRASLLG